MVLRVEIVFERMEVSSSIAFVLLGLSEDRSSKTKYVIRPGTSPAGREQCL